MKDKRSEYIQTYLDRVEEEFYRPNPSVLFILRQLYHAVCLLAKKH